MSSGRAGRRRSRWSGSRRSRAGGSTAGGEGLQRAYALAEAFRVLRTNLQFATPDAVNFMATHGRGLWKIATP